MIFNSRQQKSNTHHQQPGRAISIRWLALTSAISVANPFYSQLLLPQIEVDFNLEPGGVLLIPMVTLIGMAVGFQLLLPLGDIVQRKTMLMTLAVGMGLTCIGVATAPNFASLLIIFWAMGLTALIPSLLPATVSALTPKQYRGQVLGILLSGTFSGIIIARSICGIVAQSWGWKSVYILAAIGMLGTALIFKVVVPEENMRHKTSYWALQQSLLLLWKQHSDLRLSCKINTLLFSCYLGIWSLLPLLLSGSPWKFGPGLIGTFGFLGLGSILAAPLIGRLIDRFGCEAIVKSGISTCLLGITIMVILKNHLPALVAGIIALDLGFKSSNIANQTRIQLLDTSAGSRMNGQYFMLSYVGAAIFSGLIVLIWKQWEWTGSCCIMLLMILIALLIEKTDGNRIRSV